MARSQSEGYKSPLEAHFMNKRGFRIRAIVDCRFFKIFASMENKQKSKFKDYDFKQTNK